MLSSLFLSATNHLLAQAGWARQRLQAHAGRTARLELAPLTAIDFSISAEGQLAEWSGEDAPEVCLRLAVAELPPLLAGGMESVMRHVRIEGNADFAEALAEGRSDTVDTYSALTSQRTRNSPVESAVPQMITTPQPIIHGVMTSPRNTEP